MRALVCGLLLSAAPSWALTFGTGCANPCGVEEIVAGGSTICTIVVGADTAAVTVVDAHYVVHHTDGDQLVEASGTPATVPPGGTLAFPATISADAADTGTLRMSAVGDVTVFGLPAQEVFPDTVTIVPVSTCSVTTTTQASTTTPSTTTTVQTILGFPRMRVCLHNGTPKKCD